jgi:hypothetical protein
MVLLNKLVRRSSGERSAVLLESVGLTGSRDVDFSYFILLWGSFGTTPEVTF